MAGVVQRIRTAFVLSVFFGTLLIAREFTRQKGYSIVVNNHYYHSADAYYSLFMDQPRLLSTTTTSATMATTTTRLTNGSRGSIKEKSPSNTFSGAVDTTSENSSREEISQNTLSIVDLQSPITRPNDNNTAIVLIAMGFVSDLWLTERCLRSIRIGGNFQGTVLVITDKKGFEKYNHTLRGAAYNNNNTNENGSDRVVVVKTRKKDTSPNVESGVGSQYFKKRRKMLYKRYKTLILEYLENAFLDNPENFPERPMHALYLDVDNIVAKPLSTLFDDYFNSIQLQWADAHSMVSQKQKQLLLSSNDTSENSTEPSKDLSFFSMWRDPHMKNSKKTDFLWQSGQIMLSTEHSGRCLETWRYEMDHTKHMMDQALLFNVYERDFIEHRCLFFELPFGDSTIDQNKTATKHASTNKHFQLVSKDDDGWFPTILHLTKARLERLTKSMVSSVLIRVLSEETISTGNAPLLQAPPVLNNGTTVTWHEIIDSFVQLDYRKKRKNARQKKKKRTKRKSER